jgi:hypothetical protein
LIATPEFTSGVAYRIPAVRRGFWIGASYVLLALISFYPQSLRPWDTLGYVGDSLESAYLIAWHAHQSVRDPRQLFDANILYPHPRALTFTDHQWLSSLSVAPIVWLTGNAILAYNVAVLWASLLAAAAGWRLGRVLGLDRLGAWTAGALYAFHTYQINEAPRIQTIFHGFTVLALADLLRYLRTGERAAALRVGLFMLAQALCSNYFLLYGCVLIACVCLAFLVATPRVTLARLPRLAVIGAVAGLVYLPIGLPYVLSSQAYGYTRDLPAGIDVQHYLSTAPTNIWYGPIGAKVKLQMQGPHFVGFVALGLALVALARALPRRGHDGPEPAPVGVLPTRVWVPGAALYTLLLAALSLGRDALAFGHDLGPGPYRLLYHYVPGFELMRLPERLGLLAMAGLGVLAGWSVSALHRRGGRGAQAAALTLAAAVPLEHLSPIRKLERVPVGAAVPAVYRWLAGQPVRALAVVPVHGEGLVRKESLDMYFSSFHFKPIVHGYASYPTQLNRLLRRLAAQFPLETTLQAFARIGVDTVVVHHARQPGWDLYHQLQGRDKDERFRELLPLAGLDTFGELPRAVAAGRLQLLARFESPGVPVFDGGPDEVYRLLPGPRLPAAPFPEGRVLREPGWRFVSDRGNDPRLAGDGQRATSWRIDDALGGDESLAVLFGREVTLSGVVLPLEWDSVYPTRFVVEGLDDAGRWRPLARFGRAHALQLLDTLLQRPRAAAFGFAWPARAVFGLRLAVEAGGTSFDGWSVPEIEVRVP